MTATDPRTFPQPLNRSPGLDSGAKRTGHAKACTFSAAVRAKVWAGDPVCPGAYRDEFARGWSRFIRSVFTRWQDYAGVTGLADRTAQYHWKGSHRPEGHIVAMLAPVWPDQFRRYCGTGAGA